MIEQLEGIRKVLTVKGDTSDSLSPLTVRFPIIINKAGEIPAIDELLELISKMPW